MAGLGRKVFTRERATVSDVQGYLMDQTVMSFASVSARNAAIPAPWNSARTFQTDTGTETVYFGGAWRKAGSRRNGGRVRYQDGVNSDAAGLLIFAHGLGVVPGNIQLTPGPQASDLLMRVAIHKVVNYDATNIVVGLFRTDTSAYIPNNLMAFEWSAEV